MSFNRLRLINLLILPIAILLATGCGSDAYIKEIGDGICQLDENGCPIDPNDPDCTGDYSHCGIAPTPPITDGECPLDEGGCPIDPTDPDCIGDYPPECGTDPIIPTTPPVVEPDCPLDENGCPIDPNDPDCDGDYDHCYPVTPPIPNNMVIDTRNPIEFITSVCDNSFNPPLTVLGVIDNDKNKIVVPLHYTVAGDSARLGAYTKTVKLSPTLSEDGEDNVFLSFVWGEQDVGKSGYIYASIIVDDSAGNNDGKFNVKCGIADRNYYGVPLAIFDYPVTTLDYSQFTIKATAYVISDDGGSIWLPIVSPNTGAVWLNNNLNADYITVGNPYFDPHKQAQTSKDPHAYGGLYQWGRKADGHQLVTYPDEATGVATNGTSDTKVDEPTNALFIMSDSDWRVHPDQGLWKGLDAKNRVCPKKYRLATDNEWIAEYDGRGALGWTWLPPSFLKLSATGIRNHINGLVYASGHEAHYWTSTIFNTNMAHTLFFNYYEDDSYTHQYEKADGNPVRCRMDDKFL